MIVRFFTCAVASVHIVASSEIGRLIYLARLRITMKSLFQNKNKVRGYLVSTTHL
jgi:hypothetical protein